MSRAVAFTGISNSGKTTLIINITKYLQNMGFKVAIIKHDPKDKAVFDKEGKDSDRFFKSGADVAVVSPNRTTIFKHSTSEIEQIAKSFDKFDYLLVEGLKTLPLPKICVVRNEIFPEYFNFSDLLAVDFNTIDINKLPKDISKLDLNDLKSIVKWIDKHGKVLDV